jgi:hypothetical protein
MREIVNIYGLLARFSFGELKVMPTETTIILAIIGMLGLFATATVYQRANRISSHYYKGGK